MQVRSTEEARSNLLECAIQLLSKMQEKKAIDADIKEIKEEWKSEGVPVGIVTSLISAIKASKKKTDAELFELDTIKEWMQADERVDDGIGQLID